MDARVALHREPICDQARTINLGRWIKVILSGYRKRRVAETGASVDSLFTYDPPLVKEAWQQMWGSQHGIRV